MFTAYQQGFTLNPKIPIEEDPQMPQDTNTPTNPDINTHRHTHTHTHILTHTDTHTHIHTQTHKHSHEHSLTYTPLAKGKKIAPLVQHTSYLLVSFISSFFENSTDTQLLNTSHFYTLKSDNHMEIGHCDARAAQTRAASLRARASANAGPASSPGVRGCRGQSTCPSSISHTQVGLAL